MKDLYREIVNNVKKSISSKPGKLTRTSHAVSFVVKRFIHYMMLAIMNGYVIKMHIPKIHFSLEYEKNRELENREKKVIFRGNYIYDYFFRVNISSPRIHEEYYFKPDEYWAEMLQDILDSDRIYEYIQK